MSFRVSRKSAFRFFSDIGPLRLALSSYCLYQSAVTVVPKSDSAREDTAMASRQARTTLVGFALLPFLHVRWWTGSPLLLLRISLPGLVGLAERFFVGFLATVVAGLFLAHRIPPFLPR